jgi:hypothetical protein
MRSKNNKEKNSPGPKKYPALPEKEIKEPVEHNDAATEVVLEDMPKPHDKARRYNDKLI